MSGISANALTGTNYPENRLKYNGKELQHREFGDGSGLEWYDYGLREYDHQTGRFFRVDPLAEEFYYLTPYQYASNNPATNIDLDGLEGMHFQEVFNYLVKRTVQNPNGTEAKVLGTVSGVGGSIYGVGKGLVNTVAHPVEAAKGIFRMMSQTPAENAVDYGVNVVSNYTGTGSDAFTEYATGAHVLTDIGMALSPLKGGTGLKVGKGAATEGAVIGDTAAAKGVQPTALVTKYPANAAIAGTTENTFLMPGQVIDRYGPLGGKWFSTPGTSYGARSMRQSIL